MSTMECILLRSTHCSCLPSPKFRRRYFQCPQHHPAGGHAAERILRWYRASHVHGGRLRHELFFQRYSFNCRTRIEIFRRRQGRIRQNKHLLVPGFYYRKSSETHIQRFVGTSERLRSRGYYQRTRVEHHVIVGFVQRHVLPLRHWPSLESRFIQSRQRFDWKHLRGLPAMQRRGTRGDRGARVTALRFQLVYWHYPERASVYVPHSPLDAIYCFGIT